MEGWFKLHRKIIESPVFDNPDVLKMWVWMLAKASHKEHDQIVGLQIVKLQPGEFIFGRRLAAESLKLSENKVYRILKLLEHSGMVRVKSNNKFSVINIVNWDFYQNADIQMSNNQTADGHQIDTQIGNNQTADGRQIDTNKNEKNVENGKNGKNKKKEPVVYYPLDEKLNQTFLEFIEARKKIKAPMTEAAIKRMLNRLDGLTNDNNEKIAILDQSIRSGWKDVYPLKDSGGQKKEKGFYEIAQEAAEEGDELF